MSLKHNVVTIRKFGLGSNRKRLSNYKLCNCLEKTAKKYVNKPIDAFDNPYIMQFKLDSFITYNLMVYINNFNR